MYFNSIENEINKPESIYDVFVNLDLLLKKIKEELGVELNGPFRNFNDLDDDYSVSIYESNKIFFVIEIKNGAARLIWRDPSELGAIAKAEECFYDKISRKFLSGFKGK